MRESPSRRRWTRGDVVRALMWASLGFAVTLDAWVDIFRTASRDPNSTYIFLVPPVAVWLVWVRRARFRQCGRRDLVVGYVLVLSGWTLFVSGERSLVEPLWHLGALVLVSGCLLSVLGTDALLRFLPAFLVSGFLVPLPAGLELQIGTPLATATARATQGALEIIGSSIHVSAGLLTTVDGLEISISPDSSGLAFLMTLAVLASAVVFGAPLRNPVRFSVLVACLPFAFLAIVTRAVLVVWSLSQQSQIVAGQFHSISAFVLPVSFMFLLALIVLLRWALVPVTTYPLARTD